MQVQRTGTAFPRRFFTISVVVLVIAAMLIVAGGAARADNASTITATSSQAYTVPAGVHFLYVSAVGARGGNNWANPQLIAGGRGGVASGTLRVTPGQTLQIHVGSAGGDGSIAGFPAGGANCGGNAASGAGAGGGASDIRTANSSATDTALVVAGGGGGGGADGYGYASDFSTSYHPPGGPGGDAGQPGAEGGYQNGSTGGAKGGSAGIPAGDSRGGTGSGAGGGAGTPGCGGAGDNGNNSGPGGSYFPQAGGGGGGGGYYGGGGGGVGCGIGPCATAAGGGGGGSNFVAASAIAASTGVNTAGATPQVKVTPVTPIAIAVGPPSFAAGQRVATVTATVTDFAGNPATADTVTFTSSSSGQTFSDYANHGDGTYTATVTSPSGDPSATITAQSASDSAAAGEPIRASIDYPESSTTSLSCGNAPVGTPATCTVTVAGGGARPTGTVAFSTSSQGSFDTSSCTLPSGGANACQVAYTPSAVGSGSHAISATYNGDANYGGSAATDPVAVTKGSSSVGVACQPASAAVGESTTCTATVAGPGARPGGAVSFGSDSAGDIGSGGGCTLPSTGDNECSVTYTPSKVESGAHTITATYAGDANRDGSSDSTTETVTKGDSSVQVDCQPASTVVGASVDCTATVSGDGERPSGAVAFSGGSGGSFGSSGSCTLPDSGPNRCSVSYTPSEVQSGTHTVTATYGGDANYTPSADSSAVSVSKAASTTALACQPDAGSSGNDFVCTASVTGAGARPSGDVSFSSDSTGDFTPSGTCSLPASGDDECSVTYTPSSVGTGTHHITASYVGDENHDSSDDAADVTVTKRSTATTVACAPPSASIGNAVSCTATVEDSDTGQARRPSGTVQFASSGSGDLGSSGSCALAASGADECSVTYTPSAVGSGKHKITATYSGDADSADSSDSATVAVSKRASDTTVACAPAAVQTGTATTCTATVADSDSGARQRPGGVVTFSSDSSGDLGSGGSCTLPAGGDAACSVSYTPTAAGSGTHTITAAYSGDGAHAPSRGQAAVTATLPPAVTPRAPGRRARAVLSHRTVTLSRAGLAVLRIRCARRRSPCAGRVALQSTSYGSRLQAARRRMGRAMTFRAIRPGSVAKLSVPLPKASKRALQRRRRAVAMAIIRLRQPDGTTTVIRRAITLIQRR